MPPLVLRTAIDKGHLHCAATSFHAYSSIIFAAFSVLPDAMQIRHAFRITTIVQAILHHCHFRYTYN